MPPAPSMPRTVLVFTDGPRVATRRRAPRSHPGQGNTLTGLSLATPSPQLASTLSHALFPKQAAGEDPAAPSHLLSAPSRGSWPLVPSGLQAPCLPAAHNPAQGSLATHTAESRGAPLRVRTRSACAGAQSPALHVRLCLHVTEDGMYSRE